MAKNKKQNKPAGEVKQKQSVGSKVKDKISRTAQTVKVKVQDYNNALKRAYNDGFQDGLNTKIPKVAGARAAATVGYGNGIKARAKQEKSQKELEKSKRTTCSTRKQTAKR